MRCKQRFLQKQWHQRMLEVWSGGVSELPKSYHLSSVQLNRQLLPQLFFPLWKMLCGKLHWLPEPHLLLSMRWKSKFVLERGCLLKMRVRRMPGLLKSHFMHEMQLKQWPLPQLFLPLWEMPFGKLSWVLKSDFMHEVQLNQQSLPQFRWPLRKMPNWGLLEMLKW